MKDKTKEKGNNFVCVLEQIGIYLGFALGGIVAFVVSTSIIWLPTLMIILAIKGII